MAVAKKLNDRVLSFADIVELQDSLNSITRDGWRNVGGKNFLPPSNFLTQLIVESVEMIDDSGVEHTWWKSVPTEKFNEYNVKIELIDMVHFYVAAFISLKVLKNNNKLSISNELNDMFFGCDVTSIFNQEIDLETFDRMLDGNKLNHKAYVESILSLIQLPLVAEQAPEGLFDRYAYGLLNGVVTLCRIPADEFSALYRAKNELNRARQSKGYKNGTYVKVVDGVEDNERMRGIIDEFMTDKTKTLAWVAKSVREKFFTTTV